MNLNSLEKISMMALIGIYGTLSSTGRVNKEGKKIKKVANWIVCVRTQTCLQSGECGNACVSNADINIMRAGKCSIQYPRKNVL